MKNSQLDFSGARGIIDPLEGLKTSVQQTNSTLGQMIVQNEAEKQQELTRAREARQEALNTPGTPEWKAAQQAQQEMKISALGAEQAWRANNDPVYQNALVAMKRETPGSPEWNEAQKIIQNRNMSNKLEEYNLRRQYDPSVIAQFQALDIAKKDRDSQEYIGKQFFALPTEKVTTTTVTPEDLQKAKEQAEMAATINAGKVFNTEYERLTKPATVLDIDGNGEVVMTKTNPIMSEEEAYLASLKKSGLDKLQKGEGIAIDPSIILPKVGTTSKKEKYTADELTQAKLDSLKKGVESGKISAGLAMEVANKLTPTKTQKERLEEAKLALDVEEFKAKKEADYWSSHKNVPDGGSGKEIRTALEDMFKTYGEPDIVGTGDRADMEEKLAKLQTEKGYSDAQMTSAIEKARGIYGSSWIGVNQDGFIEAVKEGLGKLQPPKK